MFAVFNIVVFKFWQGYSFLQIFEIMNLQTFNIKGETVALMKENDFSMTNSDMKATALTLSDLYSHMDTLIDVSNLKDLGSTSNVQFVSSPFESRPGQSDAELIGFQNLMKQKLYSAEREAEFFEGNKLGTDGILDRNAYLVVHYPYNQTDYFWVDDPEARANLKDLQTCALANPYMSHLSLNSSYTRAVKLEAYMGFDNSGLFCVNSATPTRYFTDILRSPGYSCPSENVNIKLRENWNEQNYSPHCRDWFTTQKKNFSNNLVTAPF